MTNRCDQCGFCFGSDELGTVCHCTVMKGEGLKKRCVLCHKWFKRIDLWRIKKSWYNTKYACRFCLQEWMKEHDKELTSERDIWMCAHCRPPQWFTNREDYIKHHYIHYH